MKILRKLAGLIEGKREHLGRQIAREGGKPLTDGLVETDRAIDGVRNAADDLRVMAGREIPMGLTPSSVDRRAFTILEPIGVVAAISAFNHPLNLIVHQLGLGAEAGQLTSAARPLQWTGEDVGKGLSSKCITQMAGVALPALSQRKISKPSMLTRETPGSLSVPRDVKRGERLAHRFISFRRRR